MYSHSYMVGKKLRNRRYFFVCLAKYRKRWLKRNIYQNVAAHNDKQCVNVFGTFNVI